jgi:hypothetical protein
MIYEIRGQKVMLDRDLASLYGGRAKGFEPGYQVNYLSHSQTQKQPRYGGVA